MSNSRTWPKFVDGIAFTSFEMNDASANSRYVLAQPGIWNC